MADPALIHAPRLLLLLLPTALEQLPARARAEELLAAPGAVAVEPARVSYAALDVLPDFLAHHVARRQAKRMKLPGVPRAVAVFDALQLPLAAALLERHPDAELWQLTPGRMASRVALTLDFAADTGEPAHAANRPLYERMEELGIETGRLGSERVWPQG